ncbi:MAG: hypothetical protein J7M26_00115, partial [Armatimonadetes bacterium]|nr:hypothetical protein [Armatimonadota bacterium]
MSIVLLVSLASLGVPPAAQPPPEKLGRVSVRWLDPDQIKTFAVDGERYEVAVDTGPARVASITVGGRSLLGPGGVKFAVRDTDGELWQVVPPETRPRWQVWRGRRWRQASNGRARMNVWNAGPYYWDAH